MGAVVRSCCGEDSRQKSSRITLRRKTSIVSVYEPSRKSHLTLKQKAEGRLDEEIHDRGFSAKEIINQAISQKNHPGSMDSEQKTKPEDQPAESLKGTYNLLESSVPQCGLSESNGDADNGNESHAKKAKRHYRLQDFHVEGELGVGAYGTVYLVHLKEERQQGIKIDYAMKCIHKAHLSNPKTYRNTKFERFVLTHVHHPFLTAMQAAFEDARFVYFVMECATGGNIYSFIYRKSPRVQEFVLLGEIAIRFIAATIVLALQSLHANGIIYRDLKPENVLIFSDGYFKLADFGFSRRLLREQKLYSEAGTVFYLAPELLAKTGYGYSADLWSFGVVLYQLATQEVPYKQEIIKNKARFMRVAKEAEGQRKWAREVSNELKSFIEGLLKVSPTERIGANNWKQVRNHVFFNEFDWQALLEHRLQSPIIELLRKYPQSLKAANIDALQNISQPLERDNWSFDRDCVSLPGITTEDH